MVRADLKTAAFNARQAVKELCLLELHLADPEQRCPDCIMKHALTFEALADEGKRLDGAKDWAPVLGEMSRASSVINAAIRTGKKAASTLEAVRRYRKKWQGTVF